MRVPAYHQMSSKPPLYRLRSSFNMMMILPSEDVEFLGMLLPSLLPSPCLNADHSLLRDFDQTRTHGPERNIPDNIS